ncbi:sodium:solute symporter family protein [Schnuerera ultunensis]|uniref:Sodium:solute symporter family protein n=1 Tax=[Clostridium] ultunense Esp TaxID=1288971 RepID=A0A1M4PT47_9FIRM|nr:sodium:solute symporter family protein [Schnuerera ultunensis]SHD78650.1 membrane protein of unknown function [[Clostridium] ultunense Esp]
MIYRIIFALYCLFMLAIGYYGYKKTETSEDFLVAGRNLGLGVSIPLFAAGFISGVAMVGHPSYIYDNGWSYVLVYPVGVAFGIFLLSTLAVRMRRVKLPLYTTPDWYSERYYSKTMRIWMAFLVTINMSLFVIMGIISSGAVLGPVLGVSYKTAVLLIGVVFVLYTAIGGMYSVAWTNVAQCTLLTVCIILTAIYSLIKAGGITAINTALMEIDPILLSPNLGGQISVAEQLAIAFSIGISCATTSTYHRMFYSARSDRVASGMIGLGGVVLTIVYSGILFIGLSGKVLLPGLVDTEAVFITLAGTMNPVFTAIVACGIIAAIQSSIDNQLLAASVQFSNDIYYKLINPEASEKKIMSISTWSVIVIGAICVYLAYIRLSTVINLYNFMATITAAAMGVPLFLGVFWPRATKEAAMACSILGFALSVIMWFKAPTLPSTLIIIPIQLVLMIVISNMTPKPPKKVIDNFFPEISRTKNSLEV